MKNIAIILASGTGSRLSLDIPKQFYKINNKTILEHTLDVFEHHDKIDSIIIVSNPDYICLVKDIVKNSIYNKIIKITKGGKTRQESSFNGLISINDLEANVLIHDAVRPFISNEIINECICSLDKYNAVNVAVESSDTIIEIDDNNIIKAVPNRKYLRRCQTPQCFKLSLIKKAHELAKKEDYNSATDDCSLILKYNLSDVYVVKGSEKNIKITYPADIILANEFLK